MPGDVSVQAKSLWSGGVAVAVIAGLAGVLTQVVLQAVFDVDVLVAMPGGTPEPLPPLVTFVVAAVVVLLGVGFLHLLLATTPRGRTLWQLLASLVLVASVVPVAQLPIETIEKVYLVVIHLVVYLFAVPTLVTIIPRSTRPLPPAAR